MLDGYDHQRSRSGRVPGSMARPFEDDPFDGIPLLEHFVEEGGAAVALSPDKANPGIIDPATDRLIVDTSAGSLHSELNRVMTTAPFSTVRAASGNDIAVALVDLSGPTKLVSPVFAGFRSTLSFYAASVSKLALIYAAHQLRFDVESLANQAGGITAGQLAARWTAAGIPDYDVPRTSEILNVPADPAAAVPLSISFTPTFETALGGIPRNSNERAGEVAEFLGFRFTASALVRCGLQERQRGGLWSGRRFGRHTNGRWRGSNASARKRFRRSPVGNRWQDLTCLSAARMLALLVQERLVSQSDSRAIVNGRLQGSWFEGGLSKCSRFDTSTDDARGKVGVWRHWKHEAAMIERTTAAGKDLRYVLVVATKLFSRKYHRPCTGAARGHILEKIAVEADKLIEAAN